MTIISAGITTGSGVTILDSFEDGEISEYGGSPANFTVVQNPTPAPVDGTHTLQDNNSANSSEIQTASGLPNFFPKGSVANVYHHVHDGTTSMNPYHYYGFIDDNNYYEVSIDYGGQTLEWRKNDGGTFGFLESTGISVSSGQWVRINIDWRDNDDQILTAFNEAGTELGTLTVTDSANATGEGIGWGYRARDSTVSFDYAHLPDSSGGSGGSTTLIDSAEDGDMSEYAVGDVTAQAASGYSFSATDGSNIMECGASGTGSYAESPEGSGLPAYFSKGEKMFTNFRYTANDGDFRVLFGMDTNRGNCYSARLRHAANKIQLYIQDGFSATLLGEASASFGTSRTDKWLCAEVTRGDGSTFGLNDNDLRVRVYDGVDDTAAQIGNTLTVNDSTWANSNGVGLRTFTQNTATIHYADWYRKA